MQVTEITEINVDMDGVIVDFDEMAGVLCRMEYGQEFDQTSKRQFWKAVEKYQDDGYEFWRMMKPMDDALLLLEYIESTGIPYSILSAVGDARFNARAQKFNWIAHNTPYIPTVKLVDKSPDKAAFASPSRILIDDRDKCITPWENAGGVGILHTSAINTIDRIKELICGTSTHGG